MQSPNLTTPEVVEKPVQPSRAIDNAQSSRKRTAIGLSPRRPTAQTAVHRPPRTGLFSGKNWILVGLVVGLAFATLLLLTAQLLGAPTSWVALRATVGALWRGEALPASGEQTTAPPGYFIRFADDFTQKSALLACTQQAGQWRLQVDPEKGVYQMQIWPGHAAWSTLGIQLQPPYRLEGNFTVVDLMPSASAGYIGRFQDANHFYIFVVDGLGRFQVQLWREGVLETLQPWTAHPALQPAGVANRLMFEDDGKVLRLFANDTLLYEQTAVAWPTGATGLFGGATEAGMADIYVDWLRGYEAKDASDRTASALLPTPC